MDGNSGQTVVRLHLGDTHRLLQLLMAKQQEIEATLAEWRKTERAPDVETLLRLALESWSILALNVASIQATRLRPQVQVPRVVMPPGFRE